MYRYFQTSKRFGLIILLLILVGCGETRTEQRQGFKNQTDSIFQCGDFVKLKIDDQIGIIHGVYINSHVRKTYIFSNYEYSFSYLYDVRFKVDQSLAIDTAAGGGFMSSTQHYGPSLYPIIRCEEFELVKVE